MALRRITVSFLFLAAFAGAALLLWQTQAPSQHDAGTLRPQAFPVSSFNFSYASQSYFNPALPNGKAQASGFTIACESKGLVHLSAKSHGDPTLLFEFTNVLCGEADVMAERGLARTVQYSREFMASPLAVERATEDPALAIARSVFLHMDGGLRARWPESQQVLLNREERLEGEVAPEMQVAWQNGAVHWTKKFTGPVTGGASD
ncbi:MAG: hypothetical protein M3Q07_05440, partial [Pseudobdellovibrionaceae bacterium]|nr:hypothetical protein [Pseudobdellovibrionaceae bacterium]